MEQNVQLHDERLEGYITVREFAEKYNITRAAVYMMISRGKLEPTIVFGRKLIKEDTPYPKRSEYRHA